MRIACCISALMLAGACADSGAPQEQQAPAAAATAPAASVPAAIAAAARTSRLEFPTGHGPLAVDVETDETVAPGAAPSRVEVIGEVRDRAVVVVDRYPSVPGGLSMCQAGEESFVRVITIAPALPRVTFTAKVGSCLQNIELAEPGLEWRADTATLRIEWLANAAGSPASQEVVISSDGRVVTR